MPVLLLARGDSQAKDLLRSAIEARYGFRPPALEALQLEFKGRLMTRLGPVNSWLPVTATVYFKLPLSFRWEYALRVSGLPVRRGVLAYDGMVLRRVEGGEPTVITDAQVIHAVQKRLWAAMAVLLTPLTEGTVELHASGEHTLEATNTETDDSVQLLLNDDNTLSYIQTMCYNPQEEEEQLFKLQLSDGYITLNELILPALVTASWDDEPYLELEPVSAEINPELPELVFALADDE